MSDDKYLISIIIPVYNAADCISNAFDSVLNQTIGFGHLQVIMVDDASTDGSDKIIDGISGQYENVVAMHTGENSGYAGRPRNTGIERATATHLMFLDQDDSYYPEACKLLYEAALAGDRDIVSGYYSQYDHDGNCVNAIASAYKEVRAFRVSTVDDRPEVLRLHSGFWAKIYKRQLIVDHHIRFIEDSPVEDMVFYEEAALCMSGYEYVEHLIVRHSLRRESSDPSLSYRVTEKNMQAVSRGYDELYKVFAKHGKEGYLKYVMYKKSGYYTRILLRGNYPNADAALRCVKGLYSVYAGVAKYSNEEPAYVPKEMMELVSQKRYEEAARFLLAVQPLNERIGSLSARNRELKRENRDLAKRLRHAEKSYAKLQRRLKHSIMIKILNKIRRWKLF